MVGEPTAAVVCYLIVIKSLYDQKVKNEGVEDEDGKFHAFRVLVTDFGRGTSDFSKIVINASLSKGDDEVKCEFIGRTPTNWRIRYYRIHAT